MFTVQVPQDDTAGSGRHRHHTTLLRCGPRFLPCRAPRLAALDAIAALDWVRIILYVAAMLHTYYIIPIPLWDDSNIADDVAHHVCGGGVHPDGPRPSGARRRVLQPTALRRLQVVQVCRGPDFLCLARQRPSYDLHHRPYHCARCVIIY